MPSIIPGYEYDIFISYRQKDNKRDGWVTEFINTLKDEIEATFKEDISIYFDENPHDGLHEHHEVDDSLREKLKCLIFIPIVSQTYCDPKCFAWEHEFKVFIELARDDQFGLKTRLSGGNVASRVLPVKIHDLDSEDIQLFESEIDGVMRSIDFIYKDTGVNRPLTPKDEREINIHKTIYRDQINKTANAIKDIIAGIKTAEAKEESDAEETEKPQPKKIQLTSEIKRRNVIRTSLVYILSSLAIWKGAGVVGLPQNMLQIIPFILIILFPISVLMAWLYERSPKGFIRAGSTASRENPFTDAQKKPLTSNTFILLLVATVVALFLIYPQSSTQKSASDSIEKEKSIAVLPFEDMSPNKDQEYFCDGISDEIINALAKVPGLKVSGRTSSFSFKDKDITLQSIGNQLGVSTILEGSVRKSGNQLRINAKLVNAHNGFQLWTKTYNRELTEIFLIQDEITNSIIEALKVYLQGEQPVVIASAETDLNAYEIYLKARQELAARGENLLEARKLFEQVIEIDSNYAPAHSGLARTLSLIPVWTFTPSSKILEPAKSAAYRALELNPTSAEAYSALGFIFGQLEWNWEEAERNLERSLQLKPNDTEILNFLGDFYRATAHPNALEVEMQALNLDPLDPIKHLDVGLAYLNLGNWEKASEYLSNCLRMDSSFLYAASHLVRALVADSDLETARKVINSYQDLSGQNKLHLCGMKALLAAAKGDSEEFSVIMGKLKAAAENDEYSFGRLVELYLHADMLQEAASMIEKGYDYW